MWTRGKSKARDAWPRERAADPDGAWLRDTYGLEFAEREFLRRAVEHGEAIPQERLREPAAAYVQRLLERPWWRRFSSTRLNGWLLVALALGFFLMDALSLVVGTPVNAGVAVTHGVLLLVVLWFAVGLQRLRTRRLRRAAERLSTTDGP